MARATGAQVEGRDDTLGGAYRNAEPYLGACNSLVLSVAGFTFLGYWLDRKLGHSVQWLLVVGAVVGMAVGFVSFFAQIARAGRSRAALAAPRAPRRDPRDVTAGPAGSPAARRGPAALAIPRAGSG